MSWYIGCVLGFMGIGLFMGSPVFCEPVYFTFAASSESDYQLNTDRSIKIFAEEGADVPLYFEETRRLTRRQIINDRGARWLISKPVKIVYARNQVPFKRPFDEMQIGQAIRYSLDDQGQVESIEGLEAIVDRTRKAWGSRGPSLDVLTPIYRSSWEISNGFIWGVLAGRYAKLGLSWKHNRDLWFNDIKSLGWLPAKGEWTLLGSKAGQSGSLVSMNYRYMTNWVHLKEEDTEALQSWVAARVPGLSGIVWSRVSVRNEGIVVINPSTLIDYDWWEQSHITLVTKRPSPRSLSIMLVSAAKTKR